MLQSMQHPTTDPNIWQHAIIPTNGNSPEQRVTLRERAPAGGVDGDAGPKPRGRHRAVQRH